MAAAIEKETGIQAVLVKGGRGAFEVTLDGTLVFSKHATHRFPEHGEIIAKLKS